MGLVTLVQAKDHLRLPDNYPGMPDVDLKIEQASAIIIDYLKSRAHNPATVATSSVASPTVVTTSAAHTFVNGNTVVIAGHVDSEPNLNGSHVISNVLGDSFTVPVAVTVAGTGGTATVLWTTDTTPFHVQAAVLLMLTHLYEHRGDDMETDARCWQAIERVLIRSRDPAFA